MRKDYEKLFTYLAPAEPPAGLFDRIILAIHREQRLQQSKRIVFGLLGLLIVSLAAVPFSWVMLQSQAESSGILHFLSAAISNLDVSVDLWGDLVLIVLESMPVVGIVAFTVNMALLLFTVRLFLYRKRMLLGYLRQGYNQ